MAKKFTSAVIGLGQIGQGYDYHWPDSSRILTHASGFHYHDSYELVGGVDPDPVSRRQFEKKFKQPAYETIEALYSQQFPQIVAIAVPTAFHYDVFQRVIKYIPLAVICEKPIAETVDLAMEMVSRSEKGQCALLVNYIRRFEPGVLALKSKIQSGEFGDIKKGIVWYGKGLLNNGSHFIDLLGYLIGDVTHASILENIGAENINEFEPDLCIHFEKTPVYFLSTVDPTYSLNSLQLIGALGEIQYANGGSDIRVRYSQAHPEYPGYQVLTPEYQTINNDLKRYQWHMLENLKNHLQSGDKLLSDGSTAMETLKIIEELFARTFSGDLNE